MSTQGRRSGSRSRQTRGTTIDRAAALAPETAFEPQPEPAGPAADAQVLDDRATPIAGSRGPRLGRSFTGAVVGTLLVVGLAFGAALGPGGAFGPKDDGAASGNGDTTALSDGAAGHDGDGGYESG